MLSQTGWIIWFIVTSFITYITRKWDDKLEDHLKMFAIWGTLFYVIVYAFSKMTFEDGCIDEYNCP
tara:strand:+ start:91 stop:288 length:198 start_codon:yes stop_codon:yes gene_type:complete